MKNFFRLIQRLLLASTVLLAACFMASPVQAATQDVACGGGGTFRMEDDVLVSSTDECAGAIMVPANVTRIASWAFAQNSITSVAFEANSQLTTIDSYAMEFTTISSIVFPNGLKTIAHGAFSGAKFTSISIPGTVESISGSPFYGSELTTVVFEPRIASSLSLSADAFIRSSKLSSVTYSGPLVLNTSLIAPEQKPDLVFEGWSSSLNGPVVTLPLTIAASASITLYPKWREKVVTVNECSLGGTFRVEDDVLASSTDDCAGAIMVPANVTRIASWAFAGNSITSVAFEANSQLTTIDSYAMEFSTISSIVFPNGLKTIDHGAFSSAKFTSISIPGTVETISGNPFTDSELETVIFEPRIASSLSVYGAFTNSYKLRSVTFTGPVDIGDLGESGKGQSTKADFKFSGWSLSESGSNVTFPLTVTASNSVTLYPKWTAKVITVTACSLGGSFRSVDYVVTSSTDDCAGQITIPANVIEIGGWATFENRNITSVVFEANSQLEKIGYYAFKNTKFTSIDLPTGLKQILGGSFENTALTSVSIPGTVEWLEGSAFVNTQLETVIFEPRIASSLNIQYGGEAFLYNRSLRSVTFNGPITFGSAPFTTKRHAHTWVGWSTSEGGTLVSYPLTIATSDSVTLYPKYTANTYVVTYDATGGTAVAQGSAVGDQIAFPTPPTRTGYSFDAWFNYPDYADWNLVPVTSWEKDNDATLYAKWIPNTYAVTFDTKGGSAVSAISFVTDGEISTEPETPSRAGFSFTGWSATENGTVLSFPYSPGVSQNITLYAQWTTVAPPAAVIAPMTTVAPPAAVIAPITTVAPPAAVIAPITTVAPSTAVTPPAVTVVVALPLASTPLVADNLLSAGGEVSVTFSGFVPGEFVQLIVASTPRVIGSGYADSKGVVTLTGNMPASLASGSHTLAVFAPVSGIGFKQPITVTRVTVRAKNLYTARTLAKRLDISVVSPNAKVTITVASSSKKNCAVVAANLKALKAGNCVVTFTVQEPKPANGKQSKITKSIKTLVVKQ